MDLVAKTTESYYQARYPKVFKGLGKTNGRIQSRYLSSVDVDLVAKQTESYYHARYPTFFKGLGKTNWTYTIALYPDAKRLHCPSRGEFHCRLWTKLKQS